MKQCNEGVEANKAIDKMIYEISIVQLVNGCEEAVMNELKDMVREQSPVAKHDDFGYLKATQFIVYRMETM
eukprot:8725702-Alexandrium_andersonii.AAC.1